MNTLTNLIQYFNSKSGRSFKFTKGNTAIIAECLAEDESNIQEIKSHIDEYVANNQGKDFTLKDCMETFQKPIKSGEKEASELLKNFMNVAVNVFSEQKSLEIADIVVENAKAALEEFIKNEYGYIPKKVALSINGQDPIKINGITHKKLQDVLDYVNADEPIMLVGPAGSGKNVLAKQIADILGIKFEFANAVTQEYQITGFTDANGNYQPSSFYKAFTEGSLFLLDEIDASIPEALIKLNAAIANRYFDFPAPIGRVEAHPNFRVIAAGNTFGHGADFQYVGRNQLDAASLNRFGIEVIDYDENIELSQAQGDKDLVEFVHQVRKACERNGILLIVSYREISRLTKLINIKKDRPDFSLSSLLTSCVFKDLSKDDLRHIYEAVDQDSQYKEALKELI